MRPSFSYNMVPRVRVTGEAGETHALPSRVESGRRAGSQSIRGCGFLHAAGCYHALGTLRPVNNILFVTAFVTNFFLIGEVKKV